jgi:uncharacterized zinc-type alcohol dehydrogenase-like protein
MGVKLAVAMGAEVTVLSTSAAKKADAAAFGADFLLTKDSAALAKHKRRFDLIVDTVSADHDLAMYLNLLRAEGAMVLVGLPPEPAKIKADHLTSRRLTLAGSNIGGLVETQQMLDFCAARNITSEVETIPMQDIERAFERLQRADVRYRFVVDMASLR